MKEKIIKYQSVQEEREFQKMHSAPVSPVSKGREIHPVKLDSLVKKKKLN
jgi:hypothetical protein